MDKRQYPDDRKEISNGDRNAAGAAKYPVQPVAGRLKDLIDDGGIDATEECVVHKRLQVILRRKLFARYYIESGGNQHARNTVSTFGEVTSDNHTWKLNFQVWEKETASKIAIWDGVRDGEK